MLAGTRRVASMTLAVTSHYYRAYAVKKPKWHISTSLLSNVRRMLSSSALSTTEMNKALANLSSGPFHWKQVLDRDAIQKSYDFADFNQAFAFMTRCALLAEKMDHHPELKNIYSHVEVTLTTHECNGVSQKDIDMAKEMDNYARDLLPFDSDRR